MASLENNRKSSDNPSLQRGEGSGYLTLASFDIGKKNFAQYAERFSVNKMLELEKKYKALPKKFQRRVKGSMNSDIDNILKEIYLDGQRIQIGVYDLREDKTSTKLDMATRRNLCKHLYKFKWVWDQCDIFVIEQQYFRTFGTGKRNKGTEANVDAIKLAEATIMWLLDNYPSREILYFGSQYKTQILGAPWGQKKDERKKWAVNKAREIFEMRKDKDIIDLYNLKDSIFNKRLNKEEKINGFLKPFETRDDDIKYFAERIVRDRQKLDDAPGDVTIQAQAFKFRNMVACF